MDSIFIVINMLVLALILGGWIVLLIAAWRSMKALESISTMVKKIYDKSP